MASILYPHLRGDLDANPTLLERLDALARNLGKTFTVTSGLRTDAEQLQLYRHPQGYPVARPRSLGGAGSKHETGRAADVLVDGQPIQTAIDGGVLRAAGLEPLAGDAVHVQLPGENPLGKAITGARGATDAAEGAVTGAAGDVASSAAKATAKALVGVLVDAIGTDGARVLLSIALVATAVALIGFGGARALGLRTPPIPIPALAAARAAAK